jgi:thiamine phosphate synthase YjbQ (UPF0047 family)
MAILHKILEIQTNARINIHNITQKNQDLITSTPIKNGQALIFSRHTTTALTINEDEERLLPPSQTSLRSAGSGFWLRVRKS